LVPRDLDMTGSLIVFCRGDRLQGRAIDQGRTQDFISGGAGLLEHMASAVARAYNGGLGAEPPAGSRDRASGGGSGGRSPLKLKAFCCETSKGSSKFGPFLGKI